ncbi:CD209 antigen-like isoform X2 [Scyliorhinus canicula]|uniref:CD209 antigen-like isoform X2 n=1 Tax=Scyliorhinus canicula TaxID=7830 RepID=UPI0018F759FA|nr:CD209 antigen-like isoform X2 [Scyliorhinus canicula]XP_038636972.1 CD209 antigen-like isoform X2 [Scyliorhinus canicula]XP_038636974.1 CD209 antigen-like isoform X2 [Scyliorhinus canicula]XP_038636975.1 CD209 antigen-like isoform X2 [Scyliorhinus canicula]XP_038636976.1 CD209 antigen-like isoform X2 [Scyliorhinus canicula]
MTILEELRRRLPTIIMGVIILMMVICIIYLLVKTQQLEDKYNQIWGNSHPDEGFHRLRADIGKLDRGYSDLKTNVSQLDEGYKDLLSTGKSTQIGRAVLGMRRLLNSAINNEYAIICPVGWYIFAKQCFFFSYDSADWRSANSSCTQANAMLAIVTNLQLQNFITAHDANIRWIGLTDLEQVGVYRWVNGAPLVTGFWSAGEPNNPGVERCVTKGARHELNLWSNNYCTLRRNWVCQTSSFNHMVWSFGLGAVLN